MRTNELSATTDAQMWAKEWCRIASEIEEANDGRQVIDEGWMIGWFANAIEVGRDAGRKASTADVLAALPGVEKRWECYWAPMNYLKCDPFTKRHAPEFCGWRLIVPLSEEE